MGHLSTTECTYLPTWFENHSLEKNRLIGLLSGNHRIEPVILTDNNRNNRLF